MFSPFAFLQCLKTWALVMMPQHLWFSSLLRLNQLRTSLFRKDYFHRWHYFLKTQFGKSKIFRQLTWKSRNGAERFVYVDLPALNVTPLRPQVFRWLEQTRS